MKMFRQGSSFRHYVPSHGVAQTLTAQHGQMSAIAPATPIGTHAGLVLPHTAPLPDPPQSSATGTITAIGVRHTLTETTVLDQSSYALPGSQFCSTSAGASFRQGPPQPQPPQPQPQQQQLTADATDMRVHSCQLGAYSRSLFNVTNTKLEYVLIANALEVVIEMGAKEGKLQSHTRVYRALLLPDFTIVDYDSGRDHKLLLTADTTLASTLARTKRKTSAQAVARWGPHDAKRMYGSYFAWTMAVLIDNNVRNVAARCHLTEETLLAAYAMESEPTLDPAMRKLCYDTTTWRAVLGVSKKNVRALLPVADDSGQQIALHKGTRNGRDFVHARVSTVAVDGTSSVTVVNMHVLEDEHIKQAAIADGRPIAYSGIGGSKNIKEVYWDRRCVPISPEEQRRLVAAEFPLKRNAAGKLLAGAVKQALVATDIPAELCGGRGGSGSMQRSAMPTRAKRGRARNSDTKSRAKRASPPPIGDTVASTGMVTRQLLEAAVDDRGGVYMAPHTSGAVGGRQKGARDVLNVLPVVTDAQETVVYAGGALTFARSSIKKLVAAEDVHFALRCAVEKPAALPEALTDEAMVHVAISARVRVRLHDAVAGKHTKYVTQFIGTQPWLRQYVSSNSAPCYQQVVLRRAWFQDDDMWKRFAEQRDADTVHGVRCGVQRAFEHLMEHGAVPGRLVTQGADDGELDHMSAPDTQIVIERLILPPARDGTVRTMTEPGVQAMRDFSSGEKIGTYLCGLREGGAAHLDGEAAVYRAAGFSASEAADAFAVSAKMCDERGAMVDCVVSARDDKFVATSVLARMNHSSTPNAELTDEFVVSAGGVDVVALCAIKKGEMLHIDYGPANVRIMKACGIELALPESHIEVRAATTSDAASDAPTMFAIGAHLSLGDEADDASTDFPRPVDGGGDDFMYDYSMLTSLAAATPMCEQIELAPLDDATAKEVLDMLEEIDGSRTTFSDDDEELSFDQIVAQL